MAKERLNFAEELERIKEAASKSGADTNLFYITTLERYQTQIRIMAQLKEAIAEHGSYVKKEYVKGRENLVLNPAISEYNRTASAANNTVATLIKIVQAVGAKSITDMDVAEDEL